MGYQLIVLVVGSVVGLGFALGFKVFVNRKLGKYNPKLPVEQHSDHIAFHNHPHAHEFIFGNKGIKVDEQKRSNARDKVVALYLILSHRLAAGFFLGYTVFNIVSANYEHDHEHLNLLHEHANSSTHSHTNHSISLAFLIGFFLHLIPEELIIYFRQREMGISRSKALVNSVLVIMILVPFIFLGANVGQYVQNL